MHDLKERCKEQCNKDLGFKIKKIHDIIERSRNRHLKENGLTATQIHVLAFLRWNRGNPVTQKDIENYMQVSHPTVVGVLKRLEANGFIKTKMVTEGKMQKLVVGTEKDDQMHNDIKRYQEEKEARMLRGFSPEEKKSLHEYLDRLYENLNEEEQDDKNTCNANKTI